MSTKKESLLQISQERVQLIYHVSVWQLVDYPAVVLAPLVSDDLSQNSLRIEPI
jgi:hypothetical protein